MRAQRLGKVVLVLLALTACTQRVDLDKEREALLKADKEWASVVGSGDLEKVVSYWSDDAIVFPPGMPAVVGKQAIRDFVGQSLKLPGFRISWEAREAVVASGGDMGYTVGTNRVTMPGADGAPVTTVGKTVTVWRKEPNGTWRCILDIWNADSPQSEHAVAGGP